MGVRAGSRIDYMNSCKIVAVALDRFVLPLVTPDGSCQEYGQQFFNCYMYALEDLWPPKLEPE